MLLHLGLYSLLDLDNYENLMMTSSVCITVSNSPNPSSVYSYSNTGKKFSIA